jgi:hypothetical protein
VEGILRCIRQVKWFDASPVVQVFSCFVATAIKKITATTNVKQLLCFYAIMEQRAIDDFKVKN